MRAAQHGKVRRAGVEPDVERVAALLVLGRLCAKQLLRGHRLPGFDAVLLDALRHLFQQLLRTRMQRTRFAVQEKWHRHAPLPLARERPVGPVGDHAVQSRLAPRRVELCRLDAAQGGLAQAGSAHFSFGGFVHRDKPLRRGAQDHWRLVAPAMHVTVHVIFLVQQRAAFLELRDDLRIRVPDRQAAK